MLRRCSFFDATLTGCKLTGSQFLNCGLRPLTIDGGDWGFVSLRGQNLTAAKLGGLRLREADLTGADLTRADLRGADLDGVALRDVRLDATKIDMAQAVQFATAHGAKVSV